MLNTKSNSGKSIIVLCSRLALAVIGIVFVPIYVNIIGDESYGLVGFYGTLAGSLAILDLGLSTAVSRQLAILTAQEKKSKDIRDLVYSTEIIYWIIGLCVGGLIVLLAHPIATRWVKANELPIPVMERAIMLMGVVFAFQFPASIYNGVMIGREKQVQNAVITVIFTLLKAVGVIAALELIAPTVDCYFGWQLVITLLFTLALRFYSWKYLPSLRQRPRFSKQQLKTIWRFAAGMTGISAITFFLTQIDKIVVSKMVTLDFVGYYSIAFLVASILQQIISPLQIVIFPKFAALITQKRQNELLDLYHKSCRWVSIIVFPIGFTLIFFARDILMFWFNKTSVSLNTAPILQVCVAGSILNCMMWIPYFYLLAKGNTRYTIYQNLIASAILVPLLFWWTSQYGALGASYVWLAVNAGYVLIGLPVFYNLFLRGQLARWYRNDVALPFLVSGALVIAAKYFQVNYFPDMGLFFFIILLLLLGFIYMITIPELRALSNKVRFRTPV